MELKKTVSYEDFGAVGDGITDDQNAIRATHEYANENGIDVVCKGAKTYYIGIMSKTIPIKTSDCQAKCNTFFKYSFGERNPRHLRGRLLISETTAFSCS